jgi:hypothetical protein
MNVERLKTCSARRPARTDRIMSRRIMSRRIRCCSIRGPYPGPGPALCSTHSFTSFTSQPTPPDGWMEARRLAATDTGAAALRCSHGLLWPRDGWQRGRVARAPCVQASAFHVCRALPEPRSELYGQRGHALKWTMPLNAIAGSGVSSQGRTFALQGCNHRRSPGRLRGAQKSVPCTRRGGRWCEPWVDRVSIHKPWVK